MPHGHLGASPDFKGESENGLYGDSVEELDWSVGEVLRALRAFSLDERTLVIFTSDNGAAEKGSGSNGPFRGGKGRCFEGGIRVPAIFRWPGAIQPGLQVDSPAIITDTSATFAQLAGLPPMPSAIDSISIAPLLHGHDPDHERTLFFGSGDARAARKGKWKYHLSGQPAWQKEIVPDPMLFDLESDPGESNNLIEEFPEIARELHQAIMVYRAETSP